MRISYIAIQNKYEIDPILKKQNFVPFDFGENKNGIA